MMELEPFPLVTGIIYVILLVWSGYLSLKRPSLSQTASLGGVAQFSVHLILLTSFIDAIYKIDETTHNGTANIILEVIALRLIFVFTYWMETYLLLFMVKCHQLALMEPIFQYLRIRRIWLLSIVLATLFTAGTGIYALAAKESVDQMYSILLLVDFVFYTMGSIAFIYYGFKLFRFFHSRTIEDTELAPHAVLFSRINITCTWAFLSRGAFMIIYQFWSGSMIGFFFNLVTKQIPWMCLLILLADRSQRRPEVGLTGQLLDNSFTRDSIRGDCTPFSASSQRGGGIRELWIRQETGERMVLQTSFMTPAGFHFGSKRSHTQHDTHERERDREREREKHTLTQPSSYSHNRDASH